MLSTQTSSAQELYTTSRSYMGFVLYRLISCCLVNEAFLLPHVCALQMNITFSCRCAVCWWQPEFRSAMSGRTRTKSVTKKKKFVFYLLFFHHAWNEAHKPWFSQSYVNKPLWNHSWLKDDKEKFYRLSFFQAWARRDQ